MMGVLGALGLAVLLIGFVFLASRLRFADQQTPAAIPEVASTVDSDALSDNATFPDESPADAWEAIEAQAPAAGAIIAETATDLLPEPPKSEPEPELAGPQEPWTAAYAAKAPVMNADAESLRVDFAAAGHDDFPEELARRWWENVSGQAFNWGQDAIGGKRIARFQGMAKLRAPWRTDTLLRMTLLDSASFELFFWRGNDGVSLRYYTTREPHVWAAYRIHREDVHSPAAIRTALLTTDNGDFFRSTPGTFELQAHDGELILARGGIPLLTVPLGGLPEEVLLEGQCRFRGLSVHKSEPFPLPEANPHPAVFEQATAKWNWQSVDGIAALSQHPLSDGRVKFTIDSHDQPARSVALFPRPGLYEIMVRIDEANPGTAIILGDSEGKPVAQLAVFRDQKSQRLTFGTLNPGEARDTADYDVTLVPTPYFAPGQWVRMVAGLGTLQVWTSGDRRHWGHVVTMPTPDIPGGIGSIGVSGLPGPMPRSITLGHLNVRELSGLTAWADPAWKDAVPDFAPVEMRDHTLWMHRALAVHPAGADTNRWLNTCAVHTLERGPQREFGLELLRRLLADIEDSEAPPLQIIAALNDAALLTDTWEERSALRFADALQNLGLKLLSQGDRQPSRMIRAAWLRMPLWTVTPAKSAFDRLANRELTAAVGRGDWKLATTMAQESRFWNLPVPPDAPLSESAQPLDRLAGWVRAVAVEQQPGLAPPESALPLAWRHPFLQQVNKEGYNLRAELDAALVGEAYDDACRLVTSLKESVADGLLPDLRDRQLFVSMPTAILTAQREHPEFAAAMNRQYCETGLIRVRQAIADGQADVLRAATIQFLGTPAASAAHLWLGDQHLAAGKFSEAEAEYRFGLDAASSEQRDELIPRLRLAGALSGKPVAIESNDVPTNGIILNGVTVTAAEFTALVQDAEQHATLQNAVPKVNPPFTMPIVPATYKLEPRAQFDGHPGNNPGRAEYRFGDPFGKQLAVAVDDQHIYLSNRFQINAYDLQTGQATWTQGVGSEQGEAHDFPFLSMRPLIYGDHIFVRRLTRAGVELCCLKRSDGSVVWKQRPMTHVLTDPVIWQGELCALIGGRLEDEVLQVEFARFDQTTGQVTSTKPLARFRDVWNQAIPCRWTVGERLCRLSNRNGDGMRDSGRRPAVAAAADVAAGTGG